jgi:RNA polymerase sigma factor (sigma-70 family)
MVDRSTSVLENLEQRIHDCIAGERQAQNCLYEHFAPRLFMVCLRYTSSRVEAEDILQEGFIRIFTYLKQYKHEGSFEGWMRRIMVNCALQRYGSHAKMGVVIPLTDEQYSGSSNNPAPSNLGQKELLALVQKLPPGYRMVFNLYVFEGLKHREIAAVLGISEGTSKSNLSDARTILQKEIHKLNGAGQPKIKCL